MTPDYSTIFIEAARSAFFIPLSHETTLYAMKQFGQDIRMACVAAGIGAVFGQFVNWVVGTLLNALPRQAREHMTPLWQTRLEHFGKRYGMYLLVLSWLPLVALFTVMAGMLGVPFRRALPWLFLAEILHYVRFLW